MSREPKATVGRRCERGSALLFAMVTLMVLTTLSVAWLGASSARVDIADQSIQDTEGRLLADSALSAARASLDAGGDGNVGLGSWSDDGDGVPEWGELSGTPRLGDGNYWAQVTDLDAGRKRITAWGRSGSGPAAGAVIVSEMIVRGTVDEVHPAFTGEYAIYVGGGGLTLEGTDTERGYYCNVCDYHTTSYWSMRSHRRSTGHGYTYVSGGDNGDVVDGDAYVNGDINVLDGATIAGDVRATGNINIETAEHVDGDATTVAEDASIPPPDFVEMDYENIPGIIKVGDEFDRPDQILQVPKSRIDGAEDDNIKSTGVTTLDPDNPCHIFAKDSFTDEAYGTEDTTALNYQFGDWATHNGGDGEDMVIKENGNGKTYFIEGNLWIDPLWYGPELRRDGSEASASDGVQMTIVVEGNIYIGDEIGLANMEKSGIALIAITKRDENGVDVNLNDDPSDDLVENSGNIMFGDLNRQARSPTINAMLFAEKNFEDRQSRDGNPIEFTLNGLMAAGGSVVLDRGEGDDHVKMSVSHDQRILDGDLSLPNLPQGGGGEETVPVGPWVPVVRWHVR